MPRTSGSRPPGVTLNLGLRYDYQFDAFNQG